MKKIIIISSLLFVIAVFFSTAQVVPVNNEKVDLETPGVTSVKWENTVVDFGEIKQNNPATASFVVVNTGEKPVIITNAKGSCGCTNIKYPKEPIKPGESATVKATYNAKALGAFNKSVTVDVNIDDGQQILILKGKVIN